METLQKFILGNMEAILTEWEKFARKLSPTLAIATLRDHAQETLETIARDMGLPETREDQERKSRGEAEENKRSLHFSLQHASCRLAAGFDLNELVSEYRALRASVIRLWTASLEDADPESLYQLTRFNEAVDQALTYAIGEFGRLLEDKHRVFSRELHESEERYRTLAEVAPDAMLVTLEGRFAYANPAAASLLGAKDVQEVVGQSPFEFLDASSHEMARERIRMILEEGRQLPTTEYRLRRRDGSLLDVEAASSPIKWNGKQAIQIVARDITRRKRLEDELREADQRKDEFLATLAHELRNPLAPIKTGIEVLRFAKDDLRAAEDSIDMMDRQVNHLVRLVDDLLDISRISQGKITLHTERVDAREVITKALEASSAITNAGHRQVYVAYPPNPLIVKGDPVRLVQVVGNLLSNAGKYTSEAGRIWIQGSLDGDWVKISVRDDGLGLAPEARKRLFQMFMQIDANRMGGLGIGLALAKRLVELHGGTIEARSAGLGKGSEFIVCLPLAKGKAAPELNQSAPPAMPDMRGKRVLVVDDNQDAAQSLGMLLSLMKAKVSTAYDGRSALKQLEDFQPDIVLLDLGMPEMDGYEVARKIRSSKSGASIFLVAVTGWGQEEDRQRTTAAGFDEHLVKPIDMEDLARVASSLPK